MTENDRLIYGGAISRMTTTLERERVCEGRREEMWWGCTEGGDAERKRKMTELNRQRVERELIGIVWTGLGAHLHQKDGEKKGENMVMWHAMIDG